MINLTVTSYPFQRSTDSLTTLIQVTYCGDLTPQEENIKFYHPYNVKYLYVLVLLEDEYNLESELTHGIGSNLYNPQVTAYEPSNDNLIQLFFNKDDYKVWIDKFNSKNTQFQLLFDPTLTL